MSDASKHPVPQKIAPGDLVSITPARLAVCVSLVVVGLASSIWAYRFGRPSGSLFYWGILPGAPLVVLGISALIPRFEFRAVVGAAIGAFVGIAGPYALIFYESLNYSGGGANIGAGLLLLATPLLGGWGIAVGVGIAMLTIPKQDPQKSAASRL